MGFLAPALPWIIKGLPIAAGLFGGGGQSKQAQQSQDYLGKAQAKGFEVADKAQQYAQPFANQAGSYIPKAANYWQSLLSGNRNALNEAVSPERDQMADQFRSARYAIMSAPRGGGRTSALAQMPGQQAGADSRLLSGVRGQAAGGLLSAGAQAGNMLTSLLNTSTQGIYGTSGAANTLLNYDLERQKQSQAHGQQIGSSIFDLVRNLPDLIGSGGARTPKDSDYKRLPLPG